MRQNLRENVLRLVHERPGTSTRDLARGAGLSESTTDYHLRKLAKAGLVRKALQGRTNGWYAAEARFCPVLRRAIPVMRRSEAVALVRALGPRPLSAGEIAFRAGISIGAVRWAAASLRPSMLLARSQSGRVGLAAGADRCVEHAIERTVCPEWGRCALSAAWESAQGPTSSPSPCARAAGPGRSSGPPRAPSSG